MKYKVFIMASMILTMQNVSAAAAGELRRFSIDEAMAPGFSAGLRTYMGVSAIARGTPDVALTFKATTDGDDANVLWWMRVKFVPLAKTYGSKDVLKSKVEAKIFFSPDTYKEVYSVDWKPKDIASEGEGHAGVFFKLSDGLDRDQVREMNRQKMFEWPIPTDTHFPGDKGLQSRDRIFGHTTPQDIINGIDTLRTLVTGPDRRFPWYTLRGIDYHRDATSGIGFAIRALHTFGIRMERPLSLYLNHDYAAAYRSCISFAFTGPEYLTPEGFIAGIRRIFFEEGRDARGGRGGNRRVLRDFFPDAYPHE